MRNDKSLADCHKEPCLIERLQPKKTVHFHSLLKGIGLEELVLEEHDDAAHEDLNAGHDQHHVHNVLVSWIVVDFEACQDDVQRANQHVLDEHEIDVFL